MDARDYPEAYIVEEELESYGTRNHVIDAAARIIKKLRAAIEQQKEAIDSLVCTHAEHKRVIEQQQQRIAKLEKSMAEAKNNIHGAKLCEINSMSSRHEMLRLMDKAIAALEQKEEL